MIRRMEERDLPLIAELEKLCFSESWSYSILESGIHSPYDVYYVFEQAENILGYCNLRVLAGEGEVQRIAVHPSCPPPGTGQKNDGCHGRVCYPGRCLRHQPGGARRQPRGPEAV